MHLRKFIYIIIFVLSCCNIKAQLNVDSTFTNIALIRNSININKTCFIFIDSNNCILPKNILKQQHWTALNSVLQNKVFVPNYWTNKRIYLQFSIKNSESLTDTVYFNPGVSFQRIAVYKLMPGNNLQLLADESKTDGFQPIAISGNEKATFITELHFTKMISNTLSPQIVQKTYLSNFETIFNTLSYDQLVIGCLLSGILLMIIFFSAHNFILLRKKEFLYNCCYTVCMFWLIFLNTHLQRRSGLFAGFFMGYLAFILLIAGMIFYLAFTRKFLDTETNHPLLNSIFYFTEKLLLFVLICFSIIYFFTNNFWLKNILENGTKLFVMGIGVFYIVIGIKHKNKLWSPAPNILF